MESSINSLLHLSEKAAFYRESITPLGLIPAPDPDNVIYEAGRAVWLDGIYYLRYAATTNSWQLYRPETDEIIELTEHLKQALAPVRDLEKEAILALGKHKGWKLHLDYDYRDAQVAGAIIETLTILRDFRIITAYKIGRGGGVDCGAPGKEATVYAGHGVVARLIARYLEGKASEWKKEHGKPLLLDHEKREVEIGGRKLKALTLWGDVFLTKHVAGRFSVDDSERSGFNKYGWHGVPYLIKDRARLPKRITMEDCIRMREAADAFLRERYGEFYTSGFIGAKRIYSEPDSYDESAIKGQNQ